MKEILTEIDSVLDVLKDALVRVSGEAERAISLGNFDHAQRLCRTCAQLHISIGTLVRAQRDGIAQL